jgi:hypothetical protein
MLGPELLEIDGKANIKEPFMQSLRCPGFQLLVSESTGKMEMFVYIPTSRT